MTEEITIMYSCSQCGKIYSTRFNLKRHKKEIHESNDMDSLKTEDDESMVDTETSNDERSILSGDENSDSDVGNSVSESQDSNSPEESSTVETDSEYSESDNHDHESQVWDNFLRDAWDMVETDQQQVYRELLQDGENATVAELESYKRILPKYRKAFREVYYKFVEQWMDLKNDHIHNKVMMTKRKFMDEDGMKQDEATRAAIKHRKYLLDNIVPDEPIERLINE